MAVVKVLELIGDSSKSFEDAIKAAISDADSSIKGIRSAWVKDQSVIIENGSVAAFRVALKVSFEIER